MQIVVKNVSSLSGLVMMVATISFREKLLKVNTFSAEMPSEWREL